MKLDFMNDLINNSSYTWVPIVAFAAIIVIAALIGFWNGWKTSLYFFGWNLVGAIAGVLSVSAIIDKLDGIGILKVLSSSAEAFWGLLILFVFMAVTNLFAFLFYWIFRKKLKKSMKDNKKANKSNLSSRFIGMGIAVVSASPAAIYLADSSAVMSKENGFTKFLDAMTKAYTGGKFDGTSSDREMIHVLSNNIDAISDLADAFSGGGATLDADQKAALQKVLDTDLTKNIDSIYDGLKSSGMGGINENTDLGSIDAKTITDNVKPMGLTLSAAKKAELKDSITNLFKNNGNAGNAAAIADALIAKITA